MNSDRQTCVRWILASLEGDTIQYGSEDPRPADTHDSVASMTDYSSLDAPWEYFALGPDAWTPLHRCFEHSLPDAPWKHFDLDSCA